MKLRPPCGILGRWSPIWLFALFLPTVLLTFNTLASYPILLSSCTSHSISSVLSRKPHTNIHKNTSASHSRTLLPSPSLPDGYISREKSELQQNLGTVGTDSCFHEKTYFQGKIVNLSLSCGVECLLGLETAFLSCICEIISLISENLLDCKSLRTQSLCEYSSLFLYLCMGCALHIIGSHKYQFVWMK